VRRLSGHVACRFNSGEMQRYVAFLSGLPVGPQKVDMETLTNLFRKLGFLNVETYLTTGNVSFDTAPVGVIQPLEAQISRHLKRSIDAEIWTFIRTPQQLATIASNVPFTADEMPEGRSSVFVVLLSDPLNERTERRLRVRRNDADVLRPHGTEIYWLRRATDDASSKPLSIGEMLDVPATVRTLGTIKNLASSWPGPRSATASLRSRR